MGKKFLCLSECDTRVVLMDTNQSSNWPMTRLVCLWFVPFIPFYWMSLQYCRRAVSGWPHAGRWFPLLLHWRTHVRRHWMHLPLPWETQGTWKNSYIILHKRTKWVLLCFLGGSKMICYSSFFNLCFFQPTVCVNHSTLGTQGCPWIVWVWVWVPLLVIQAQIAASC